MSEPVAGYVLEDEPKSVGLVLYLAHCPACCSDHEVVFVDLKFPVGPDSVDQVGWCVNVGVPIARKSR